MKQRKVSIFYKAIKWIIKTLYPKTQAVGREKLPDEACIIIGNHSQFHGPIISEAFMDPPVRTWCIGKMMHLKEVPHYVFEDFWPHKSKATAWVYKIVSYLIAPLSVFIFNNADTIGVYTDNRIISTIKKTVATLQEGKSVVIFPEQHKPNNNIVNSFQKNFVDVARVYYKKTGKKLYFVPMYIAPGLKKYYFAEPVQYDPDNDCESEKMRICKYLSDSITSTAQSLPRHRVVPYENISKDKYPFNR